MIAERAFPDRITDSDRSAAIWNDSDSKRKFQPIRHSSAIRHAARAKGLQPVVDGPSLKRERSKEGTMTRALLCLLATGAILAMSMGAMAQTEIGSQKYADWQLVTYALKATRSGGVRNGDPRVSRAHVIQQYAWNADRKSVSLITRVRLFGARRATLMFILPPETDKGAKVDYAIDSGPDAALAIVDCDNRMCLATAPLDDHLLPRLQKGASLTLRYRARGERFMVPVSLIGFSRAYEALGRVAGH